MDITMLLAIPFIFAAIACGVSFAKKPKVGGAVATLGVFITLVMMFYLPLTPAYGLATTQISQLVAMTVLIIGVLASLCSVSYMTDAKARFYPLLLVFIGGTLGLVLSQNIMMLYLFLEVATLSSTVLIAHEGKDSYGNKGRTVDAATKYAFLNVMASVLALIGLILIYQQANSFDLKAIATAMAGAPKNLTYLISILLLIGLGTKGGLVPLHAWLPDAYGEAPTPVTIMLAGAMTEVALYALAVMLYAVIPAFSVVQYFILLMAVLTIAVGSLLMFTEKDLKKLLAYSSIEQSGLIIFGIALMSPLAMVGGVFQMVNHMLMKSLLFICAGAIIFTVGTKKIDELSGLAKRMPVVAVGFIIGFLAIAGVPPFNGFQSEYMILQAAFNAGLGWLAAIAVVSTFPMFAMYLIVMQKIFFEGAKEGAERIKVPAVFTVSIIILSLACIVIGLYPELITKLITGSLIGGT